MFTTDLDLVKAVRAKGDADFFFFLSQICGFGYNPDPYGPHITEDQHELADFLQTIYDKKEADPMQAAEEWLHLVMTPRDTLKSTVLQIFALWIATKNPDVRILFYGEIHEQAQKRLAVVKNIITSRQEFINAYGNLDGSSLGYSWNEERIIIATRKNTSIRESTIETAGLDVVVNSRHYDWIFPDDIHSLENTKSRDQIDDVKDKLRGLAPLLDKTGHIIFAGVFWSDSDAHTWLLTAHEEDNAFPKPTTYIRDVYADDTERVSRYPNALPVEVLKRKRGFLTTDVFACQYRMNPTSKQAQRFKKEWFSIIKDADFATSKTFILVDPAGDPTVDAPTKKDSDYVGILAVGVNAQMDILIRDMVMERLNPTEAVETALTFYLRFNPYVIGIEKVGLGNMRHYLTEELRARKRYALIEDLKPGNRSKYSRIIELEPLARRRKIYLAQESNYKDEFFDQITKITNGIKSKHDDLIDPLAYIFDLLKMYGTGIIFDPEAPEVIPPELRNLDPMSRDYWMSVRRAKERKNNTPSWVTEFEA
jgi:hypothetical protein